MYLPMEDPRFSQNKLRKQRSEQREICANSNSRFLQKT
jgi:hypothetical protein